MGFRHGGLEINGFNNTHYRSKKRKHFTMDKYRHKKQNSDNCRKSTTQIRKNDDRCGGRG